MLGNNDNNWAWEHPHLSLSLSQKRTTQNNSRQEGLHRNRHCFTYLCSGKAQLKSQIVCCSTNGSQQSLWEQKTEENTHTHTSEPCWANEFKKKDPRHPPLAGHRRNTPRLCPWCERGRRILPSNRQRGSFLVP